MTVASYLSRDGTGSAILPGSGRVTGLCVAWRCFYRVTPSRQTNIRGVGFGSVPVTALLVYLFQLVLVTFTYLRADFSCDVTTASGLVGSGHGSKIPTRFHLCCVASYLIDVEQDRMIGSHCAVTCDHS